jgi:hypothetical protein
VFAVRSQCWSGLLLTVLLCVRVSPSQTSGEAPVGYLHDDSAAGCRCLCLHDELGVDHGLQVDFVVARGYSGLGEAQGGECERDHGGGEHVGSVFCRVCGDRSRNLAIEGEECLCRRVAP